MGETYKMITVVGTSERSVSEAIESGVTTAAKSVRNIGWFAVKEIRGRVQASKVAQYQVTMDLGFRVED